MTIFETLKSMGIENTSVLLPKTQRKLQDYNKNLKSGIARDKEGVLKPGFKQKLDDLAEDIIIEAKLYLKSVSTPGPDPAEVERQEQERIAAEEAAEKQRIEAQEAEKQKNIPKEGPLQNFLGW